MVDGQIDWEMLEGLTRLGIEFLDDVIDANKYPLSEIDMATKMNRKVGLGVMGFADMLVLLGIKYNDQAAIEMANKVMGFIQEKADAMSVEIGQERGSFPNFIHSIFKNRVAMRNATRTAIAPTGTISLIAGASSGIEPIYSVYHVREISGIGSVDYFHPLFVKQLSERGLDVDEILPKIKEARSIDIPEVPDEMKEMYVTALDVSPEFHIKIQAAFQDHVDNSVSKTINMPEDATIEDVKNAYLLAWRMHTKGITIFRNNSKASQVLQLE
jgi:ribonucleoside-diphosphate reductase alpha chain